MLYIEFLPTDLSISSKFLRIAFFKCYLGIFMKKILSALLMLQASFVFAGTGSGQVTHIMVIENDAVIFSVEQHLDKPACSTVRDDWAVSLTTETGKAMYALLLSAAAQNQSVEINGKNDCIDWHDRETPLWIQVEP